jgi:hypothetical protein
MGRQTPYAIRCQIQFAQDAECVEAFDALDGIARQVESAQRCAERGDILDSTAWVDWRNSGKREKAHILR